MAGVDKKRLDDQIAKAKARREKAVVKQAKRFLDVMVKATGDEYVDADLLSEFLGLPVIDILRPLTQFYNTHAKNFNAKIPDERRIERMFVFPDRLLADFEAFIATCNPIDETKIERSPDHGPCSVGKMMAARWPKM